MSYWRWTRSCYWIGSGSKPPWSISVHVQQL
ncbi:hypothetical protein RDI58_013393 [Solanum bulbocastanum]|uniref:Uncharacterized protein n=1 Tax=Solanum bulbocastanum TaxID=147425 RepID=A0AAN8TRM3_SOLBU